jgi:fumarate hydratase class II
MPQPTQTVPTRLESDSMSTYVNNSLMLVTALSPKLGYDKAAHIAHTAYKDGISLREACVKLGFLTGEAFDAIVRPEAMTHP